MGIRQRGQITQIEKDLRYQLFHGYLLFIMVFAGIFMIVHIMNHRPVVNIITTAVIFIACLFLYFTSRFFKKYHVIRIFFMVAIVFFFIPFGYWTSPGSDSAVIYTIILVVNMITFVAVFRWEYLFAVIACLETIFLLQTELWFPQHYISYANKEDRILDLSLILLAVCAAIIITIYYVMNRYAIHSEQLYVASVTDSLTGLYNRRYFNDFIQSEFNRANRYQEDFSIILLDLNNFKKINDQFGHMTGDQVLIEIAELIRKNIRSYDVAARFGGDEFILIFPNTLKVEALELFRRLESAFEIYSKQYSKQHFAVSYGIEDSRGKTLEEIYKMTDTLMYKKKIEQKKHVVETIDR